MQNLDTKVFKRRIFVKCPAKKEDESITTCAACTHFRGSKIAHETYESNSLGANPKIICCAFGEKSES